jgi:hypothetical protein
MESVSLANSVPFSGDPAGVRKVEERLLAVKASIQEAQYSV